MYLIALLLSWYVLSFKIVQMEFFLLLFVFGKDFGNIITMYKFAILFPTPCHYLISLYN